MKCNPWVGGSIGRRGFPMLGTGKRGLSTYIKELFKNGEQGFFYDPNDLTAGKANWRKNQLLNTNDFTYGSSGKYTAVKEADGWALTAIAQDTVGYPLLGVLYPIGSSSDSRGAGTIVRSIEVKKGTGVFRFGSVINGTSLFVDVSTMTALYPPGSISYTITDIGSDWYRIETFRYATYFGSIELSNYIGWSTARAANSTLDTTNQVGTVIRVRNPSFAFVPYETTESIPYQEITDFNSDFIRQFPLHTLYQDAAGTVPVTGAGQPVGLLLDKSKGLALSAEKLTNGDFSNGSTGWNYTAGVWDFTNGFARKNLYMSAETDLTQGSAIVGKWYKVTYTISRYVEGNHYARCGSAIGKLSQGIGTFTSYVLATSTAGIGFGASVLADLDLVNISVKEIEGNHAYQTTSSARPVFKQKPIFGSDIAVNGDFNSGLTNWTYTPGGWSVNGGVVTSSGTIGGLSYLVNINSLVVGDTAKIIIKIANKGTKGSLGVAFGDGTGDSKKWTVSEIESLPELSCVAELRVNERIYIITRNGWDGSIDKVEIHKVTGYRTDQNYIEYDKVDDKLITNLPAQLTGCTVIRSVPNVGTQIFTNQTIPTPYNDNTDHCGLIVINRALTATETSQITKLFDKAAGV